MLEVADIIRLHGAAYCARFGPSLAPSQRRALRDLAACRTPASGGHVHQCEQCGRKVYTYHSCGNRSCPKCHRDRTARWLAAQRSQLLPCAYYLLTFTLPSELRALVLPISGFRRILNKPVTDETEIAALCPSRVLPCLLEHLRALDGLRAAQGMDLPAASRIHRFPVSVNRPWRRPTRGPSTAC